MKKGPDNISPSGPGGDSAGARTQDPLIKSQVLYQLSYGISFSKRVQRYNPPNFYKVDANLFWKNLVEVHFANTKHPGFEGVELHVQF